MSGRLPELWIPPKAFPSGYAQRTQWTDAPLPASPVVGSPGERPGRSGGRAAPSVEQRERDGKQRRSDEQAEEAERDEAAEHAQDRQTQRHRHAGTDQEWLDKIVDHGDDESPEDHENAPALLVLAKQPNRRAHPDHDD